MGKTIIKNRTSEYVSNFETTVSQQEITEKAYFSILNEASQSAKLLTEYKRAIDEGTIVSKTNTDGIITYVNDQFCDISGYSAEELIGVNHNIIRHPDLSKSVFRSIWNTLKNGRVWKGILKNKAKNGSSYYVDTTICPIRDTNNVVYEYIALRKDITDFYKKKLIITHLNTENITQLENLNKLKLDIKNHSDLALFKINQLSDIQQTYNSSVFKKVLKVIASLFKTHFLTGYRIYYCDDNTFAVLTNECESLDQFKGTCCSFVNRFHTELLKVGDIEFSISMNVAIVNVHFSNNLYVDALKALRSGIENTQEVTVFTQNIDTHKQLMSAIDWSRKIKIALQTNDIAIFGQNICNPEGKVQYTEVLVRYFDKKSQRYISPHSFLSHTVKAQLYNKLSLCVIKKSFSYFSKHLLPFSLNLTMNDISNKEITTSILRMLSDYDIGSLLTIELVESTDYDYTTGDLLDFLYSAKSSGCKIALDDFGSGFSSFENLMRLPIDILKIDGSLIKLVNKSQKAYGVIKTLLHFSKSENIKVVAEFVETKEIFDTLRGIGIDYLQGYYLHKPELLN